MKKSMRGIHSKRLGEVAAELRVISGLLSYRKDLAEMIEEASKNVAMVAEELDKEPVVGWPR